jgi:hypothetical protein
MLEKKKSLGDRSDKKKSEDRGNEIFSRGKVRWAPIQDTHKSGRGPFLASAR